jgi:hypothetical protein
MQKPHGFQKRSIPADADSGKSCSMIVLLLTQLPAQCFTCLANAYIHGGKSKHAH